MAFRREWETDESYSVPGRQEALQSGVNQQERMGPPSCDEFDRRYNRVYVSGPVPDVKGRVVDGFPTEFPLDAGLQTVSGEDSSSRREAVPPVPNELYLKGYPVVNEADFRDSGVQTSVKVVSDRAQSEESHKTAGEPSEAIPVVTTEPKEQDSWQKSKTSPFSNLDYNEADTSTEIKDIAWLRRRMPETLRTELERDKSFYRAVWENQWLYRARNEGRELPELSEHLETEAKRIFAPLIDQEFPRILLSLNTLADTSQDRTAYHNYGLRFPESVSPWDRVNHQRGSYALNEYANNFATSHFLRQEVNSALPKVLRSGYAELGNLDSTLAARYVSGPVVAGIMKDVQQTARSLHIDYDEALFRAHFQHDFGLLNSLLANTTGLRANNVDELAIIIGKTGESLQERRGLVPNSGYLIREEMERSQYDSLQEQQRKGEKGLKRITGSLSTGGYHAQPGIARLLLMSNMMTVFWKTKYTGVHEALHGYSASADHVGFIPVQLEIK